MKEKKKSGLYFKYFLMIIAVFAVVALVNPPLDVQAQEYYTITMKTKTKSTSKIKLAWEKNSKVKKWVIKKALISKKGKRGASGRALGISRFRGRVFGRRRPKKA